MFDITTDTISKTISRIIPRAIRTYFNIFDERL